MTHPFLGLVEALRSRGEQLANRLPLLPAGVRQVGDGGHTRRRKTSPAKLQDPLLDVVWNPGERAMADDEVVGGGIDLELPEVRNDELEVRQSLVEDRTSAQRDLSLREVDSGEAHTGVQRSLASKMGSSTNTAAICPTRSWIVGIPTGRVRMG